MVECVCGLVGGWVGWLVVGYLGRWVKSVWMGWWKGEAVGVGWVGGWMGRWVGVWVGGSVDG